MTVPFCASKIQSMKINEEKIIQMLADQLHLKKEQVVSVLDLFDEGATIPFIARYRKEQTGAMDEDQLRTIEQTRNYLISLEERKESILGILEEKKLLNDKLKKEIEACTTLTALEDVYRPYKEKRKTKASEAIAAGYEPLADEIWKQKKDPATLGDEEGLKQAVYILAERLSDRADLRNRVKEQLEKYESITSQKKKDAEDEAGVFETYYDFSNPLRNIPSHRVLALDRGEAQKVLTVSITCDQEQMEEQLARKLFKRGPAFDYLKEVLHDALTRLILPSVKREIRTSLREKAHEQAIAGFASNLEHLLMTRPVKGQVLLSWDPGYAHGCKLAVLDQQGNLLETTVVFPFRGKKFSVEDRDYQRALKETRRLMDLYHPTLIVVGNGTASRESVDLIAKLLEDYPNASYVVGSEAGASVYSASELAKEEFPDLPVEERSAISIGRRVQDPLSELVKIDPRSLGIGEYQHDISQKRLKETLDFVTDKAVNRVGVNVNTASFSLLKHIAGLTKPQINKILKARETHRFTDRKQLEKLLSPKAYEQSIGFLRIPDGDNALDRTGIHPESYDLARKLMAAENLDFSALNTKSFKDALAKLNAQKVARELSADVYTITDMIQELASPGLDPRDSLEGPILKKGVLQLEDLTPGMELQGTVRNVTSFGAFVDIGLHEDGLVHISRMAVRFVKDPKDLVHTGQIVTVYVVDVDLRRKRISLSMVPLR